MSLFKWKNERPDQNAKTLRSDEYDSILKRIAEINSAVSVLETKHQSLKTDVDNLRGRFNQRLKGFKEEEKAEEKPEEKKNEIINKDEFVGIG